LKEAQQVATVLVGNLPPGTTERELTEELSKGGWPSIKVVKVGAGDPESYVDVHRPVLSVKD
jgi:hypothetical protein